MKIPNLDYRVITVLISILLGFIILINGFSAFVLLVLVASSILVIRNLELSVVILCILFPFNNLITFRVLFIDMRFIEIFWIPVFLILILRHGIVKDLGLDLRFRKYDFMFICFLFIGFFGALRSEYTILIIKEILQLAYLYSVFFVLRGLFQKEMYVSLFLKGIFCSAIIFCIFGFWGSIAGEFPLKVVFVNVFSGGVQFLKSLPEIQRTETSGLALLRTDSFFWGSVGSANLLIVFYYLISLIKTKMKYLLQFMIVVFLILTGSRSGWLVFYFLFILDSLMEKRKIMFKFVLFSIFTISLILFFPFIKERFIETFSVTEGSSKYHFAIWLSAIDMLRLHPLLGVGMGCLPFFLVSSEYFRLFNLHSTATESHNLILKILAENGIVGFIFFSMYFIMLLKPMLRYLNKDNPIFKNIALSFLGIMLMNMTMNAFQCEPFWILLGLLAGAYELTRKSDKSGVRV